MSPGCPSTEPASQSGRVNITGTVDVVVGDIVGRDKITYGPTAEQTAEQMVAVLEEKGVLRAAGEARLQRRVIIALARSLKRDVSDFDQAVTELERAVEIALDVIARGDRGTNAGEFVDKVLSAIAEKTKREDFDGGARAVDDALAELDRRETKNVTRRGARASPYSKRE